MQFKMDMKYSSWAQMGVQIGYGTYLGFFVGPKATAEVNFETVVSKFRLCALFWLELKHLCVFFQVLGCHMFAVSVFNFISQLYLLPADLAAKAAFDLSGP